MPATVLHCVLKELRPSNGLCRLFRFFPITAIQCDHCKYCCFFDTERPISFDALVCRGARRKKLREGSKISHYRWSSHPPPLSPFLPSALPFPLPSPLYLLFQSLPNFSPNPARELQPKLNLVQVHFKWKIWHVVRIISPPLPSLCAPLLVCHSRRKQSVTRTIIINFVV